MGTVRRKIILYFVTAFFTLFFQVSKGEISEVDAESYYNFTGEFPSNETVLPKFIPPEMLKPRGGKNVVKKAGQQPAQQKVAITAPNPPPPSTKLFCPPLYRMTLGHVGFHKFYENVYIREGNNSDLYVPHPPGITFLIYCRVSPPVDYHIVTCLTNGAWDATPEMCCNGASCQFFGLVCSNKACVFPTELQSLMAPPHLSLPNEENFPPALLAPVVSSRNLDNACPPIEPVQGVTFWKRIGEDVDWILPSENELKVNHTAGDIYRISCRDGKMVLYDITCHADGTWYPEPAVCCDDYACEIGGTCWKGQFCPERGNLIEKAINSSLTGDSTAKEDIEISTMAPTKANSPGTTSTAYQIKAQMRVRQVKVPTIATSNNNNNDMAMFRRRRRQSADGARTTVTPETLAANILDSDVFKAVKQTFIEQLLNIYTKAGFHVSANDLDIAALTPLMGDIAAVHTAVGQSERGNVDIDAIKASIDSVIKQLAADGAFGNSFGDATAVSFEIYEIKPVDANEGVYLLKPRSLPSLSNSAKSSVIRVLTSLYHATLMTLITMIGAAVAIFFAQ